ncbi:uncharacterized protein LOC129236394 [Anastrepha obliqua]|uniref:uncharacterized protein LOC129236394 n=1 Tax=Anastrepha obliqua TaxID=95512 RepID=UPI002409313B|nr:uncharacterized protein LOC129236394 [Anastrepha obliqua]
MSKLSLVPYSDSDESFVDLNGLESLKEVEEETQTPKRNSIFIDICAAVHHDALFPGATSWNDISYEAEEGSKTYFLVIAICLNYGASKILKKSPARSTSHVDLQLLAGTAYDYDYFVPEARRAPSHYQKATLTTTERPFIRYWNNFVRNIRLPVPSISWNMTNPLVNLFNAGATNVIDSPVGNYNRRRTKGKRSKSTRKQTKKRKHTPTIYEGEENDAYQTAGGYGGYEEPFTVKFDPRKTLYFYDPSTGQYYNIRKTQTQYLNIYAPTEQQQQQQLDDIEEQEEEEVEEPDGQAASITPQIEPPTMETSNESTESSHEPMEQINEQPILSDSQKVQDSAEVEIIPPEVENIDELEEQTLDGHPFDDIQLSKQQNVKNVEMLRNSIGTYMSDDRLNRMRQRTSIKHKPKTVRRRVKSQPTTKFTYYVLQRV